MVYFLNHCSHRHRICYGQKASATFLFRKRRTFPSTVFVFPWWSYCFFTGSNSCARQTQKRCWALSWGWPGARITSPKNKSFMQLIYLGSHDMLQFCKPSIYTPQKVMRSIGSPRATQYIVRTSLEQGNLITLIPYTQPKFIRSLQLVIAG